MWRLYIVAFLAAALSSSAVQAADMSGTWRLSVTKSHWGTRPAPVSVTLHIQQTAATLTYSGTVLYPGEAVRDFTFSGAFDGKSYPMTRSYGSGTAILRRIDANAFSSVFRSSDGAAVETTETRLSADGMTLTRHIRLHSPEGDSTSTEVYDRQ